MTSLRSVCVFCGSRLGARPEYAQGARALGESLATRGLRLVYGGASIGLMGALADAALARGGEVVGVMPQQLFDREIGHRALTQLHLVSSMHERKALMGQLSDAFIAMPGGFGTWEELFEVLTWNQIGLHQKPAGLLNIAGYYDSLLASARHAVQEGFVPSEHVERVVSESNVESLLDQLAAQGEK